MTYGLYTAAVLMALYTFYLGRRVRRAERHVEIIRVALDRHLQTGEDYRSTSFKRRVANDRGAA